MLFFLFHPIKTLLWCLAGYAVMDITRRVSA